MIQILLVLALVQSDEPAVVPGAVPVEPGIATSIDGVRDYGDWRAEELGSRLPLKALAKDIDRFTQSSSEEPALTIDVSAELSVSELRPQELVEQRVPGATVLRNGAGWEPARASSLEAALEALVAPFGTHAEHPAIHSHLKLVHVTESDGRIDCELRYDAEGPGRQQVATWNASFDEEGALLSLTAVDFEEVVAEPLFRDATGAVLRDVSSFTEQLLPSLDHWSARVDVTIGMSLLGHEGLALGDVNGDGLEDLYVLQPGGLPNRLYLHQPDHTVRDASASAGVDFLDVSRSALFLDLDGDGDQDLACVIAEELLILSNEGSWTDEDPGRFQIRAVLPGPSFFSLSAADVDADGDLDLYGCAYSLPYWEDSIPIPYHDANNGRANVLYRNDGDWSFRDATVESGLDHNNRRYSFAASWEDYDLDGDPDLYVANDFGRNNLYRNDEGRFTDVAAEAGVEDLSAGMGVVWGDFDDDGWPDLYVSNMFSSAGNRVAYQRRFHPAADDETRAQFRRHARGNSLFRNRGDGTFEDVTEDARVGMGRWAWGSVAGDWNSDGRLDLFVPNGFVTNDEQDDL